MRTLMCFAVLVALAAAGHAQTIDERWLPPGTTRDAAKVTAPGNVTPPDYRDVKIRVRPMPGLPAGAFIRQPCEPVVERMISGRPVFVCRDVDEMWAAEEKQFARDLPAQRAILVDPRLAAIIGPRSMSMPAASAPSVRSR